MDNTRNVAKNGEKDVDQEVGIAATLQEHTQRGEDDGKNDLANITVGRQRSAHTFSAFMLKPSETVAQCSQRRKFAGCVGTW